MNQRKGRRFLSVLMTAALLITGWNLPREAVSVKAADYGLKNPTTEQNGVTTWDCIYFGNYCQCDPAGGNETKEPVRWRVLSVKGNDAFLLADQNLDIQPYNTEYTKVTWEESVMRRWLNGIFIYNAFTSDERKAIIETKVVNNDNPYYGTEGGNDTMDKIYLLSIEEVSNVAYGFNGTFFNESETREALNTEYVSANEWMWDAGEADRWWLRTPGDYGNNAAFVDRDGTGSVEGSNVSRSSVAVRPVLHLDLSVSYVWSYAGTVRSQGGGGNPTPLTTPTPAPSAPNNGSLTPMPTPAPSQSKPGNSGKVKAPAKATWKSVKNKKSKKLAAAWKKVSGAKGYRIQCATNAKFKSAKTVYTKKTSYTFTKRKKKKTYYVRVCAYKTSGSKKVYGKWSSVKKVKITK